MLLTVVLWAGGVFVPRWPWPYQFTIYLAVAGLIAVVHVRRIHRRGQTVAEAMAASRAERRRQAEARTSAREAAAALPWLRDKGLRPDAVPGVLVAPAPYVPGYHAPATTSCSTPRAT